MNVFDQTNKALECKIIKERETYKIESKVILEKLEKAEKTVEEVKSILQQKADAKRIILDYKISLEETLIFHDEQRIT